jgi:hypothetical protein
VVGRQKVADLLADLGYSLQANRKTRVGSAVHPDRDEQFNYINEQARAFQNQQQPVISVDTKKKELVGDFKNAGQEWEPKGDPQEVQGHDFPDQNWARRSPMAYMIKMPTLVGSASVRITTPQNLQSKVSVVGGTIWDACAIRMQVNY